MVSDKLSPLMIANAWLVVTDEWIVRRNKKHDDGREWEVLHKWGDQEVIMTRRKPSLIGSPLREDANHDAWHRERLCARQSVIDQIRELNPFRRVRCRTANAADGS